MKHTSAIVALSACWLAASSHAQITVQATANIFSAGLSTPVGPGGGGAGTLPLLFPAAPGQAFRFQANGSISAFDGYFTGPDGSQDTADINSYGGISGFYGPEEALVGVFLSSATPQAPAPPRLDFSTSGLGRNFLTLSPQIGQVFFIGNGLTDAALAQTFYAPANATRLYLGCDDAVNIVGDPGAYGDNSGFLTVTIVPEPTALALLTCAALSLALVRKKGTNT